MMQLILRRLLFALLILMPVLAQAGQRRCTPEECAAANSGKRERAACEQIAVCGDPVLVTETTTLSSSEGECRTECAVNFAIGTLERKLCFDGCRRSAAAPVSNSAPQSATSGEFVTITRNASIIALTVAIITAATVLLIRATTRGIQTVNSTPPAQPRQPLPFVSQLRPGEILVRDKASGQIGAIPESEFDTDKYERV
jgi:hypothetical protein